MAINKVEYIKDSSQTGFAIAGEEVAINKTTAETIKTDVDEGNTEELSKGQKKFLNSFLPAGNDKTEYETNGDVTDLPPDSEDGEKEGNKKDNDKDGTVSLAITGVNFAMYTAGLTAALPAMNTFTASAIGEGALSASMAAIIGAGIYDTNFGDRLSELSTADEDIATINEYMKALDDDLQMAEALNALKSETPEGGEGAEDAPSIEEQVAALNEQLQEAQAAGDQEAVDRITAQIQALQEGGGKGGPQITPEELLAQMETNDSEASDIAMYTTDVSKFLSKGNELGNLGLFNTAILAACSGISNTLAAMAFIGANVFTISNSVVGAALCKAASYGFIGAAVTMGIKTVQEFKCGQKGNEMSQMLNSGFNQTLQTHNAALTSLAESLKPESEDGSSGGEGGAPAGGEGGTTGGTTGGAGGATGSTGGGATA